ncbi:class I glutamine amidotransferase-like protein [Trichoderma pleuroticola]
MATDTDAEAPHNNFDTILVLDFGSQTSHLILRRLRALGVYAKMLPYTAKLADLTWKPKGIVLSGGPSSVYDKGLPYVNPAVFELGVPILGICYGCQEIAWQSNSENVARGTAREYGHADVTIHKVNSHADRLFAGLGEIMHAYMSHFNKLFRLPKGFVTKPIFGIQFHPELKHTPRGSKLLHNFIIGAVSGGVDSTVAAKLMTKAIGDRFHAVHIDNGLMCLNESKKVKETLEEHLGINLTVIDGTELFLDRLKGFLQGTLYPDVIESLFFKGPSATIKTHHNVGGLPKRMMDGQGLQLLEPLRELFKDEVRNLGRRLKIHEDLVNRFPFPGPGIGVRILGECTPERIEIARQADHIFISMIKEAGIYNEISQAYAGLDTSKAVGVMGDTRVYGYIIILRAVTTSDFMSAEPYEFPFALLMAMARRIVNEVDGVSRVTYDLSSKPPGTIELE